MFKMLILNTLVMINVLILDLKRCKNSEKREIAMVRVDDELPMLWAW